jgi:phosphoribosyl 1,2-cyclic phosphodiesterase
VLRFSNLASGSGGNATLIEARRAGDEHVTRVLVDCGLSLRRLTAALAHRGCTPAQLDAVFVTHEHSDHLAGVAVLQRRHGVAVWASAGTAATLDAAQPVHVACDGVAIHVGALELMPFAVPHDAAEPLQLVCRSGPARLGILTDLGEPTEAVVHSLQGCDALLLECNHDRAMLDAGPYPVWLKRRIGGARGHLANEQAATILDGCSHAGLQHVVAAHLSQHNNEPERALAALRGALPEGARATRLQVAQPDVGCDWIELG